MSAYVVDGAAIEAQVVARLKGFQRKTVDYVFRRMYEDADPAARFLVADEVGLGKTLVARGVIARTIRHLQSIGTKRIDVIYICSNAEIAKQNSRRLNVTGQQDFSLATRITLLPRDLGRLNQNGLNFVSFTPGTSFNMASRSGLADERAVVFRLLEYALGMSLSERSGAYHTLRSGQTYQRFRETVAYTPRVNHERNDGLDGGLADAFAGQLRQRPDLIARFQRLATSYDETGEEGDWHERQDLILELRQTLARSCVAALEPDLVILDEFQRFRELLSDPDPDNPDDIRYLAQQLFEQPGVRTLLLSATPYKMFTLRDEEQDDHYSDFLHTARFLMGDAETQRLGDDLHAFRRALVEVADPRKLMTHKRRVEDRLRRFVARTERLAVTADRNGMLSEHHMPETRLTPEEVRSYAVADRVSRQLGTGDITDYWKSAPYLLNFMSDYKLKRELRVVGDNSAAASAIASAIDTSILLSPERIAAYERLDPGNARLRGLAAATVGAGTWQLLWLPPSLPYYLGRGGYADTQLRAMTKRLIFSSWNVVPDAVSVLLSYEAERQMMLSRNLSTINTAEERARLRGLLAIRNQDGRPTGMSTFSLLYPSATLAEIADPLAIARDLDAATREVDMDDVFREATRRIRAALNPLTRRAPADGPEDQRWYWAAPLLLDRRRWPRSETQTWLAESAIVRSPGSTDTPPDDDSGAWSDHLALASSVLAAGIRLGRVPADLAESTAVLALGGPGTCALRAISRVAGTRDGLRSSLIDGATRDAALRIAWGFRSLFNIPEVMALLRRSVGQEEESYWRRVATEGMHGNLQAVLDEYVHLMPEWLGMADQDTRHVVEQIGQTIQEAVSIRAANYSVDHLDIVDGRLTIDPLHMRVRFALRFGRDVTDEQKALHRSGTVRSAFNSPFWPFVLTTTSIGQEGLDFHQYCHAIVHWNLPANPVDLEQREGRVHRYKGHAIRKNVAERHRSVAFSRRAADPWAAMFTDAVRGVRRREYRDIEPFWIYEGSATIERHIPLLPLSREVEQLDRLKRSLAAYRLVFGQPRQEDLIAYFGGHGDSNIGRDIDERLRIDLVPR